MKILEFTSDQLQAILRTDFVAFVHKVFNTINPGTLYLQNWHIYAIAHEVMALVEGRNNRLIVNVPPRYLKSIIFSVALPAWLLGHDPTLRIVCVSYSNELAARFARDFRRVIESPWYKALFPATRVSKSKNTETETVTTANGGRFSTSIEGGLTGRGGQWLIIDEPMKQTDAESETARERVREWFFVTALNRLDNKQKGVIVVVMQRLHQQDLAGILMEKGGYRVLRLRAIAEEPQSIDLGHGRIYWRKAGEALHPRLEPLHHLELIKSGMGSRAFQAQYQQEPVPPEGELIKASWFGKYSSVPIQNHQTTTVISVDTAAKATEMADYSVMTVWRYEKKTRLSFLLAVVRERLEYPDLRRKIIALYNLHSPEYLLIEDKGSGTSLIQDLKREGIHAIPIVPKLEKVLRVQGITPQIERGEVLLPPAAPWLEEFLAEIVCYPQGKNNDQVDSLSQYLGWVFDGTRRTAGSVTGNWG